MVTQGFLLESKDPVRENLSSCQQALHKRQVSPYLQPPILEAILMFKENCKELRLVLPCLSGKEQGLLSSLCLWGEQSEEFHLIHQSSRKLLVFINYQQICTIKMLFLLRSIFWMLSYSQGISVCHYCQCKPYGNLIRTCTNLLLIPCIIYENKERLCSRCKTRMY